jgi:ligand-binding SRPBCC domain-containing protein
MKKFTHRFRVAAPLQEVAAFHKDAHALKELTPLPLWVQIHSVEPLAENSRTQFTLWAGPLPMYWEAIHTNVTDQGFSDTQVKGPYKYWVHSHHFSAINSNSSEVIDDVTAIYGEGLFWGLITRLMWLGMPLLFAYRGWRTRKIIETTEK